MTEQLLAPLYTWLIEPLEPAVAAALHRLRQADDICHIAVMPDVHAAADACVGTVLATRRLLYPGAVGGDIGCGMLAVAFDAGADALADPARAARVLKAIAQAVPPARRHRARVVPFPPALASLSLSHPALSAVARDDGSLQLGTLGGGNHFVELQADEQGQLWLMIHSGSRAMGQAIRAHHLAGATTVSGKLRAVDTDTEAGRAYLADVQWARAYAQANRLAIADAVGEVILDQFKARCVESTLIQCDHNHVASEEHGGRSLFVHRKGAMRAAAGLSGVLPGSMGAKSYHVEGRGSSLSLDSSAHGAGRALSRQAARQRITTRALYRQMEGVWFDYRLADRLRDEAPGAYKDLAAVLRAQRELIRVTRTLRPLLAYKSP